MSKRRDFIKQSALASASLFIPRILKSSPSFLTNDFSGKTLVVIQLSGGNDGLNCVVPFHNDLYYKLRPSIGLDGDDLIELNHDVALNSSLSGLADLFNSGHATIINNVGYPNPNHSHFRSTDIWQSASKADEYLQSGWLGRYLDSCSNCNQPHAAIELDDTLSLAMKGNKLKGMAFREPEILHLSAQNRIISATAKTSSQNHEHPTVEFLHKSLTETTQSAEYIYSKSKIYKSTQPYPLHEFAKRMKTIAELICSGSETKIYYISLPGFDTHALQKGAHKRVLQIYGDTLKAFTNDLKQNNRFNDAMIFTFSEFGRRVKQNASNGTDHGTANNVYIVGGKLAKPGIYNSLPDLTNLDEGDLIHNIDFRQVYATLLEKWMHADTTKILNTKFEALNFL